MANKTAGPPMIPLQPSELADAQAAPCFIENQLLIEASPAQVFAALAEGN